MKVEVRQVARGLCIKNNKILLAKSCGKDNYHLPGGGIHKCESATSALLREIKEELNKEAIIDEFFGIIENRWNDGDISYYETNFLFKIDVLGNNYKSFVSNEDKLSFFWFFLSDATSLNIKPEIVIEILNHIDNGTLKTLWFTNFKEMN